MIDNGAENARRRLFVVEALGPKSRELFIADFVENHPREYEGFYNHQSRGRDEDKVGRKGRRGAPRRPPSKRDNLGKDTAGNDGVTLATLMGWNTMQAAARDQCFDAFDDGRDAADVPSSSTSSPIRPRAKTIGLSVADGSDKSPPINNNGSSTINASTARPVHNQHPSSLSSKGAAASNQPVPEVDDSTIDTELPYHRERTCRSMHI